MPHNIRWHVENSIFELEITGVVTLDDIAQIVDDSVRATAESPAEKVHAIINISEVTDYPKNLLDIARKLDLGKVRSVQKKSGWVVYVGAKNSLLRFLLLSLNQLTQPRYRFYDTVADALAFLKSIDDEGEKDG